MELAAVVTGSSAVTKTRFLMASPGTAEHGLFGSNDVSRVSRVLPDEEECFAVADSLSSFKF